MVELAIVGAGPAGCAAAIWAATRGLRVLLVDRAGSPRNRPGECLHPGIEVLFRDLGILDEVLGRCHIRPPARVVAVGGQRSIETFGSDTNGHWRALHVARADLDAILLNRAQQVGVALQIHRSRVTPVVSGERVVGIDVGGQTFRSAFVIDASGHSAWLTRAMGQQLVSASPRLTAFYGYSHGQLPDEQIFEANAGGWQWMAQVAPTVVNWTSLHFGVHKRPQPPRELASLLPCGSSRGADVTWRIAPLVAGRSYFIVGDAALVTDPASGNGVLRAVMSGVKAAHNARAAIAGQASPSEAARDYQKWLRRWFEADTARLSEMYDSLRADWRSPNTTAVGRHQAQIFISSDPH